MSNSRFDFESTMFFLREKYSAFVDTLLERDKIGCFNRTQRNKNILIAMNMHLLETYVVNDKFNVNILEASEYNNIMRFIEVCINTDFDFDFVELEAQY